MTFLCVVYKALAPSLAGSSPPTPLDSDGEAGERERWEEGAAMGRIKISESQIVLTH